jgi:hypothetical protein
MPTGFPANWGTASFKPPDSLTNDAPDETPNRNRVSLAQVLPHGKAAASLIRFATRSYLQRQRQEARSTVQEEAAN